jgi:hypothetical protein
VGSLYRNLPTLSQRLIVLVALFSVTLASVPVATKSTALHVAILIPFGLCVAWAITRYRGRVDTAVASVVALYGLTIAIEMFRGYAKLSHAINDTLLVTTLIVFGATLVTSARDENERKLRMASVALAPAVYLAVNVFMQVAHLGPKRFIDPGEKALSAGEGASLLKLLGFSAQRIEFPLASGINTTGAVAAAGFAAATLLAIYGNVFPRRLTVPLAAVSLYGALATDSRVAIFAALIMIALSVFAPRVRMAVFSAVLLCIAPISLVAISGKLGGLSLLSTFSRGSSGEFSTLNGRYYIWKGAWQVAGKLDLHTLIGWGADGQISSGASRNYAYLFRAAPDPFEYTSHNILLQSILDGGYLSLVVYIVAVLIVLKCLDRSIRAAPRSPSVALRGALLVVLFGGITEALPTYNNDDCLAVLLVTFGVATALRVPARARAVSQAYRKSENMAWRVQASRGVAAK